MDSRRKFWGNYTKPFEFNILVQDFAEIENHKDWKYNFTTPRPVGSFYSHNVASGLGNYSPKLNCKFYSSRGSK